MVRIRSAPRFTFATGNTGCGLNGMTYQLRAGDVWLADDPLVLANPGLFSEEPPYPYPLRTV